MPHRELASSGTESPAPNNFQRLWAENALLRAEVERLRHDRETLKQTVEIMVEMTDLPLMKGLAL
ncbi:MAG TPA: hypothetical protein VGL42_06490 [Opitutaceae bacterium]|jgi:hypothetical protein